MSERTEQQRHVLAAHVSGGSRRLTDLTHKLRRTNTSLLISGVISSGVSTLITGITAAQGPVIGSGPEGWRAACIAAAIFSFGTTIFVGLNQRLKLSERLAETRQCAGRLRALEVALTTSSEDWDTIAREYEDIVKTYPELVA